MVRKKTYAAKISKVHQTRIRPFFRFLYLWERCSWKQIHFNLSFLPPHATKKFILGLKNGRSQGQSIQEALTDKINQSNLYSQVDVFKFFQTFTLRLIAKFVNGRDNVSMLKMIRSHSFVRKTFFLSFHSSPTLFLLISSCSA